MFDSIIILGATATGKTKISIELAKYLNTEIVNADSMYIYDKLNIGTAKPTIEEMSGVKHHLIGFVDPKNSFNVAEYRERANSIIESINNSGKIPIIVGGTGFYIESLVSNYTYGNSGCSKHIREDLEEKLLKYGKEYIYNELKQCDSITANKLHPNDTNRVIRALEIFYSTGKSKSEIINTEKPILQNPLVIGLQIDREILYERINNRVDIMIKNGLVDEVKDLVKLGLNPNINQSMKGIGYKEIFDYLAGKLSLEESIEKIKQHTRNYAKRQITWFKRYNYINWFNSLDGNIMEQITELIKKCLN